jgi:hypothetical protein
MLPILSQMNSAHTFPPYLPNIYSYDILPSMPRSSLWAVPFRFHIPISEEEITTANTSHHPFSAVTGRCAVWKNRREFRFRTNIHITVIWVRGEIR